MSSDAGALDCRLHNLPLHPTPLLGRSQEQDTGCQQLLASDVRLLTLSGPAGIGKTSLAVDLARSVLGAFPHGVWFVDLAPLDDPALVPAAIARVLGVHDAEDRRLLETLKPYLRDKQLLLVLDNFEQVAPAAAQVANLLAACPGLKALVTSRQRLSLRWERTLMVPPLALPALHPLPALEVMAQIPSVALFVERTRATAPDFSLTAENAPAVAEICTRLDGLPLAIELAAARANVLSPATLVARLKPGLSLLTWRARDLPQRHQTLRAAIGWSYDLLTSAEQALFRRLGVFVDGFPLEAADAVADGAALGLDVLDGLCELVDKSLVHVSRGVGGESRFRLLEMIREYALEQLEVSGELAVTQRLHATYFLELAERADGLGRASTEQAVSLERLNREHDNLRAALAWSQAATASRLEMPTAELTGPSPVEIGLRLAGALSWFWRVHGHVWEGRQWLEAAITAGRATADRWAGARAALVKALTEAGLLAIVQEDLGPAETLLEESLGLAADLGDRSATGWALHALGRLTNARGDRERAMALFEESLASFEAADDALGVRFAIFFTAIVAEFQGEYALAAARFEQSLALFREVGDEWDVAWALVHAGRVAHALGDDVRAAVLHKEGLVRFRDLHTTWGPAECLDGLAWVAEAQKETERAVRLCGAATVLHTAVRHPLPPASRAEYARHLPGLRAALGEEAYARAWAEGQTMRLDQAIDYALTATTPPGPTSTRRREPAAAGSARVVLSEREREVLRLLVNGSTNKEIAGELIISEATAKFHVHSILNKLGASTRGQAVALALQQVLV